MKKVIFITVTPAAHAYRAIADAAFKDAVELAELGRKELSRKYEQRGLRFSRLADQGTAVTFSLRFRARDDFRAALRKAVA